MNRGYLRQQILPHFAGRPVGDIDRREVRNWFASLRATPAAADRSMPVLSVIMREAEAMGLRPEPGACLPDLTYYWNRIQARAGLEGVRIHDLRHSYASRALALGESLTMIGRLLGHSKVGTTARYAHLVHDAEKAAAARTGDSIGAHLVPQAAAAA